MMAKRKTAPGDRQRLAALTLAAFRVPQWSILHAAHESGVLTDEARARYEKYEEGLSFALQAQAAAETMSLDALVGEGIDLLRVLNICMTEVMDAATDEDAMRVMEKIERELGHGER